MSDSLETLAPEATESSAKHPFEQGLELYEQKAPLNEVVELFEQGLLISPRESSGHTCLAWLLLLRQEGDDASKALAYAIQAVRLDRHNFQAHFNLVLAMLVNGQAGVRKEFQQALSKCLHEEDVAEVVANLKDALERRPDFPEASKMLNWIENA